MHLSIQNVCHETILLITNSALSFIIYECTNILGAENGYRYIYWDNQDIATAFVATCS